MLCRCARYPPLVRRGLVFDTFSDRSPQSRGDTEMIRIVNREISPEDAKAPKSSSARRNAKDPRSGEAFVMRLVLRRIRKGPGHPKEPADEQPSAQICVNLRIRTFLR
jgi:hypothetical protein